MKHLFTLLLAACLWAPIAYAQTDKPVQQDSTKTVKKEVERVKSMVADTTRREKVQRIRQAIKDDVKKEGQTLKNKVPVPANQVKKTEGSVKGIPQAEAKELKESVTKQVSKEELKNVAQQSVGGTTGTGQVQQIGNDVKEEGAGAKTAVTGEVNKMKQQALHPVDTTRLSKEQVGKLLENKATNLQYSSDDPDNAPWKKEQFSKEDLSNLGLPGAAPGTPSTPGDPSSGYKDKIGNLNSPTLSEDALKEKLSNLPKSGGENLKNNRAGHLLDSVLSMKDDLEAGNLKEQLLGAKKVYSDKYMKRIYDSLGAAKADSMFKVVSTVAKKETSEKDLLSKINSSLSGKEPKGVGLDEENQSLKLADTDKLGGLQDQLMNGDTTGLGMGDLSDFRLPQDVLSQLPPLSGNVLDSKYMPYIDSMRRLSLKDRKLLLQEDSITEKIKRTAFNKKPSFLDKIYFEGLLSFSSDSTVDIIKLSPTIGYHFTEILSAGVGPNLVLQVQERKLNALAGVRTFAKAEVWKQRAYLQLEDNIDQFRFNSESLKKTTHAILGGGGIILPVMRSLGVNLALLYRLNRDSNNTGHSPWVFRVGISTIKNKDKDR